MKVETASLVRSGAPRRRVLFSEDVARGAHGVGDRTRAGIVQGACEWAEWAARLVSGKRRAGDQLAPLPGDEEIEVR